MSTVNSEKTVPVMETRIKEISRYGNITLAVVPEALQDAGFELADIIQVKIGDHEMEMPVGAGYYDADSGEPVCCLLTDTDGGNGWVVLVVNAGNMAAEMELAEADGINYVPGSPNAPLGEDWNSVPVYLRMVQKQGFIDEFKMHRAGSARTNNRNDYEALSDREYANFREIKTTGMEEGILFRSSSPVNPALNRNKEADEALQAVHIRTIINMTDSEERMRKYEGYGQTGYSECNIIALNMGMDFFSDDFQRKLAEGFRFFITHGGPFLIHCTEGKDRAGFAAAILECLMGADMEEITADYMLSYYNFYGIEAGSDQYELISSGNIQASLAKAFGAGLKSFDGACLARCAERYLRKAGLNTAEILALKTALGR